MQGQMGWGFWLRDCSWSDTAAFSESHILAEVGMNAFGALDEFYTQGSFGISQVISNNVVENFPDGSRPNMVAREKATSITFTGVAIEAGAECRWLVNFW